MLHLEPVNSLEGLEPSVPLICDNSLCRKAWPEEQILPEHFFIRLVGVSVVWNNPRPEVLMARAQPSICNLRKGSASERPRTANPPQALVLNTTLAPGSAQKAQAAAEGEAQNERQHGPQRG